MITSQRCNGDGNEDEDSRSDNDERSIFFVRGVMETVKKLRWVPDIIHCHGWMTSLTPLYIKKAYAEDPSFRDTKVIFSLYDRAFKTPFDPNFANKLLLDGITPDDINFKAGTPVNTEDLTKLAINYSDGIIQASEKNLTRDIAICTIYERAIPRIPATRLLYRRL